VRWKLVLPVVLALVLVGGLISALRLAERPDGQGTFPADGPAAGVTRAHYPWLTDDDVPVQRLDARFPPTAGATRLELPPDSFGAWLRGLPVRLDRAEVHTYRGAPIHSRAEAVVLLDLGRGDLQQCADTIIRLHAEYLWAVGRADGAAYHFTSGDRSSWRAWRRGQRFAVSGSRVVRLPGLPRHNDHDTYRGWLQYVFRYAGTRSMPLDSRQVAEDEELAPGDFFDRPGSPGHVVLLLDVAVLPDGRRMGLVGQGYTPAQDLHVLRADEPYGSGAWFWLPGSSDSITGELRRDLALRFR